jgi:hypothetical protein
MSLCARCEESIVGEYIEALDAEWHPRCFVCEGCGKALSGGFLEREGKPYHEACFHESFSPRCAGCGKPLARPYITALGRAWHPAHFRCERCGKPFNGEFFEHEGKAYCEADYHQLFSPRCMVCGAAMRGEYTVNGWGEQYCPRHERDLARCYSCNRPMSQRLTGGGVAYRDGRSQCNLCRQTSVHSVPAGEEIMARVRATLAKSGIKVERPIPLKLADAMDLRRLATHDYSADPSGIASTRLWTEGDREVGREVEGISILHGLPEWHFAAVAAHELGHAWLFINRYPTLPPAVEEGICELCEYLWLREQNTTEARWLLEAMEQNPDPIYGEGYRAARRALDTHGLQSLLAHVRQHGQFPEVGC